MPSRKISLEDFKRLNCNLARIYLFLSLQTSRHTILLRSFMKSEGSIPCSYKPATGPCHQPDKYNAHILSPLLGRAMAHAVSRRPLTAEARVRSRVSPCEICGGQSGTGTGFSPSCRFFPVNFIPLVLH
jgi:hypothetical protein